MVHNIGIVGSGKMGQDIFNYLNDFDFHLFWFTRTPGKREKLEKSYSKKIARQLKHNLITQEQFEQKSKNQISGNLSDLSGCDLIIETIVDDIDAKFHTFSALKKIVQPGCIVVSNSSSFLPSKLSIHLPVAGMHFFYPIAFKNIVELILPDNYNSDRAERLKDFLSSINKKYVIQNERNAFLLNRFLLDLQGKVFHYSIGQNFSLKLVDQISQTFVQDFGLFEMMDHVGLSTMNQSIQNYALMDSHPEKYDALLDRLNEKIALGQPMLETDSDYEVDKKSSAAILAFLRKEIQETYNQYLLNQPIHDDIYKNALKEFCGLEL